MVGTAINLYSVRALDEPTLDTLDRVIEAGYDGVQFSGGLGDASPRAVADHLADHGVEAIVPHVDIDRLKADLDGVYRTYHDALDCSGAVVPYLGPEDFATAAAVDDTAERLNALHEGVRERDWDLHYHNHAHELAELDSGERAFDRLLDATEIAIEPDVGWLAVGGVDPADFIETRGERIDVVHMKDMDVAGENFCEIGTGDVDMAACAEAARAVDAAWLVYEHDDPDDPVASIEAGADFLADL